MATVQEDRARYKALLDTVAAATSRAAADQDADDELALSDGEPAEDYDALAADVQQTIDALGQANEQSAALSEKVATLEEQIGTLETEAGKVSDLESQLDAVSQQRGELAASLAELAGVVGTSETGEVEASLSQASQDVSAKAEDVEQVAALSESSRNLAGELRSALDQAKADQAEVARLSEELGAATERTSALGEEAAAMLRFLNCAKSEVDKLKNLLRNIKGELEQFRTKKIVTMAVSKNRLISFANSWKA